MYPPPSTENNIISFSNILDCLESFQAGIQDANSHQNSLFFYCPELSDEMQSVSYRTQEFQALCTESFRGGCQGHHLWRVGKLMVKINITYNHFDMPRKCISTCF